MDEENIFLEALDYEGIAREQFLAERCGTNPELRLRILRLLESHQDGGSFMERPPLTTVNAPGNESVMVSLGRLYNKLPQILLTDGREDHVVDPQSTELGLPKASERYQFLGEIARGGMGAIIKGRDRDLGRDLAVKVLLESNQHEPDYVRRFVTEAQINGQLQHPGIVPVYELGQLDDDRPFFSMKLVKGKTLAEILRDRKRQEDISAQVDIFEKICQTLAYAHSRNVIHRDLKPANIMVGMFGEVQVMDWGLAKVLPTGGIADEALARAEHQRPELYPEVSGVSDTAGTDSVSAVGSDTQHGSVMGTSAYMPPEQARGNVELLDKRSDVFSLGAILAEILTGKPPYACKSNAANSIERPVPLIWLHAWDAWIDREPMRNS